MLCAFCKYFLQFWTVCECRIVVMAVSMRSYIKPRLMLSDDVRTIPGAPIRLWNQRCSNGWKIGGQKITSFKKDWKSNGKQNPSMAPCSAQCFIEPQCLARRVNGYHLTMTFRSRERRSRTGGSRCRVSAEVDSAAVDQHVSTNEKKHMPARIITAGKGDLFPWRSNYETRRIAFSGPSQLR